MSEKKATLADKVRRVGHRTNSLPPDGRSRFLLNGAFRILDTMLWWILERACEGVWGWFGKDRRGFVEAGEVNKRQNRNDFMRDKRVEVDN